MRRPNLAPLAWVALIFLCPLVVYVFTFGLTLSTSHARWGEFGSAMAGIYAPIVALTTLAVLAAQVRLQRQLNEHEFRQAHIAQAREDIEFYGTRLVDRLEEVGIPGHTYRQILDREFHPANHNQLDSPELRQLAADLDSQAPEMLALWMGVYPILHGLSVSDEPTFQMTLESSKRKLIALMGFGTCVALDNYHRTRCEGKLSTRYVFSEMAAKAGKQ